ncbi:hypothetical protein KHP57_18090, partial [Algiphilus sp. NNCM1]|nr:hypothetical protein [Algiphilus acroporae]
MANDTDEGALYLHWRFDSAAPAGLDCTLQALVENARQAGVELSFDANGQDAVVKIVGLQDPMPAVLEALALGLSQAPAVPLASPPLIAIRALLKALPACCAGAVSGADKPQAAWASARWQGLAVGFSAAHEAAIKAAAARLPGQPASL